MMDSKTCMKEHNHTCLTCLQNIHMYRAKQNMLQSGNCEQGTYVKPKASKTKWIYTGTLTLPWKHSHVIQPNWLALNPLGHLLVHLGISHVGTTHSHVSHPSESWTKPSGHSRVQLMSGQRVGVGVGEEDKAATEKVGEISRLGDGAFNFWFRCECYGFTPAYPSVLV